MIDKLIVFTRLKEICPTKNVESMSYSELVNDTNVAFKIIGYVPKDLESNVRNIFINENHVNLYDFIFDVWWLDNGY